MTRLYKFLAVSTALAMPQLAHAQDETRLSADVALSAGYSNNPFAESVDNKGSGYVALDFEPEFKLLTPRSTYTVAGAVHQQQYFTRYGDNGSYRGSVAYSGRPSERLSTYARLDLSSAIIGTYENFVPTATDVTLTDGAITGGIADVGTVPLINDLGLFGSRDRRRSVYASAGLTGTLSARDSVSASAFGDSSRYRRFAATSNYDGYGGSLGYSRQVSANFQAGLQGSVSTYDYRGPQGRTNVYSVEATGSGRLNEYWTLSGSIGVSFVNGGSVGSTTSTSLSGSATLCRRGQRSTMCAVASRQVRPTGLNGAQYVTTLGANWRYALTARSNVNWNASYAKEGGVQRIFGAQGEYLSLSAGYDRQIRERLRFVTTARYRRIFGSGSDRAADYGGQVGLAYRLGDLR